MDYLQAIEQQQFTTLECRDTGCEVVRQVAIPLVELSATIDIIHEETCRFNQYDYASFQSPVIPRQ